METFGRDKLWHFVCSAVAVFVAFAVQTVVRPCCCCVGRKWNNDDYRLLVAAVVSLTLGLLKELLDALSVAVDIFPWCPCHFDVWDLIVDINGVSAALVVLVLGLALRDRRKRRMSPPCDETVASTVVVNAAADALEDDDDDDDDFTIVSRSDLNHNESDEERGGTVVDPSRPSHYIDPLRDAILPTTAEDIPDTTTRDAYDDDEVCV